MAAESRKEGVMKAKKIKSTVEMREIGGGAFTTKTEYETIRGVKTRVTQITGKVDPPREVHRQIITKTETSRVRGQIIYEPDARRVTITRIEPQAMTKVEPQRCERIKPQRAFKVINGGKRYS